MRRFLNHISLYRLTLYYLETLIVATGLLTFLGILPYRLVDLIFSTSLIVAVCLVCNWVFAKSFGMTSNRLSAFITGLILALIVTPVTWTDIDGIGFVIFASSWAIASKYIIVVGRKRIFNPAAFGVAFASIALGHSASWWIGGNMFLLPIVLTGGALILYKLRCFGLVASFASVALITIAATMRQGHGLAAASEMLLHSMMLFFAFVMLTEPRTMPPGRWRRLAYGSIIGFLFAPTIHFGSFYFTPETALVSGNLFGYLMSALRPRLPPPQAARRAPPASGVEGHQAGALQAPGYRHFS